MRNLHATQALNQIEAIMMATGPHLGHKRARHHLHGLRAAIAQRRPVLNALADEPEIAAHLDRPTLADLLAPRHYVGLSLEMVDRVLARGALA